MSSVRTPPWLMTTRAAGAFLHANVRYRLSIAGAVEAQLGHWERRALAIGDPTARALATSKLADERLNAEGAAMLACRAPSAHRHDVLEAIIALEVLYDYLDGLSEPSSKDALRDKRQLYTALLDAVTASPSDACDYYRHHQFDDGGYMTELARIAGAAIDRLPARGAVREVLATSAARCAEAQVRVHAAQSEGRGQAEEWARRRALDSPLRWREFLAGAASSVVAQHALIAAAADVSTTSAQAAELDELYLAICVVTTLLDSLIDREHDSGERDPGFLANYESMDAITAALVNTTAQVLDGTREVRDGAFHLTIFVGIVAYYASAAGAECQQARQAISPVVQMLGPLISPSLVLWRIWRARRPRNPAGQCRDTGPGQRQPDRLRA
jgi:tetraprenyl-beta-curcumene synthase